MHLLQKTNNMNLQYLSDNKGLGDEETDIPNWHIDMVSKRLAEYQKNPSVPMDFDTAMDDIEKALDHDQ
jgi:hypothetical protein